MPVSARIASGILAATSLIGCGSSRISGSSQDPPNRAPSLTQVESLLGGIEDAAFSVSYAAIAAAADATDPDDDVLSFRLEDVTLGELRASGSLATPGETLLGPAGSSWSWTPPPDANGTLDAFRIVAFDGSTTSGLPVQVRVVVAAVNDAPTLTQVESLLGGIEDAAFSVSYAAIAAAADATDPDDDVLSFRLEDVTLGELRAGGSLVTPGETLLGPAGSSWSWTPPPDANGTLDAFRIVAFDGLTTSGLPVQVRVVVAAVNDAPTLSAIDTLDGGKQNTVTTVSYADLAAVADAHDVDGDVLAFRVSSIVAGELDWSAGGSVLAGDLLWPDSDDWVWMPPADTSGSIDAFALVAFDGALESPSPISVRILVSPANRAPSLTSVTPLEGARVGVPLTVSYAMLASNADELDADGDAITFELAEVLSGSLEQSGSPALPGASLTPSGPPWEWTPAAVGDVAAFTVVASDGLASSAPPVQVTAHVQALIGASWLGGYAAAPTGWAAAGEPTAGPGDGMMNNPNGVLAYGGYLYVTDSGNHRVLRFDESSGEFAGWIGIIDTTPTGGASGCALAPSGTVTPGWCLGGTAQVGDSAGGLRYPRRLAANTSTLFVSTYVGDFNHAAIRKYALDTGAFVDSLTSTVMPVGMAADDTYLYVAEQTAHRVTRIELASGEQYWIGRTATTPTNCVGVIPAVVPAFTGSWCQGGTSQSGSASGELNRPSGLRLAGTQLYVIDQGRVQRFAAATGEVDSSWSLASGGPDVAAAGGMVYITFWHEARRYDATTGALQGWTGRVFSVPTACVGAIPAAGDPAGSWCTGGSADLSSTIGQQPELGVFLQPYGIEASGTELYVADSTGHWVQRLDAASGHATSWLGGSVAAAAGWITEDAPACSAGTGDGLLAMPIGVVVDTARDTLYAGDSSRLSAYRVSDGAFIGWSGRTREDPTSCTAGTPVAIPGPTGGWCKGGAATAGTDDGELNDSSPLAFDGAYIYAFDASGGRIVRFAPDGAFAGWIGYISSKTGMTAPQKCVDAPLQSFTPDWCFGGASEQGNQYFDTVSAMAVDGTTLYATDHAKHQVDKIDITAGGVQFVGWTGLIGMDGPDLPSSCSSGVVPDRGETTRAWCLGGSAGYPLGAAVDGAFRYPAGIAVGSDGTLYVSDQHRITKLSADGVFLGWLGAISGTISGGACDGATGVTPGWCSGGQDAQMPHTDGGFSSPEALVYDNGYLYVANQGSERIDKLDATTGAHLGWVGEVAIQPTGGGPACTSATIGQIAPGWCKGGRAGNTGVNGGFTPKHVAVDARYVYVTDSAANRITRFDK